MTLNQLKKTVAAYLGTTTADLTRDSLDLFLIAANNARKEAELLHSFEMAKVSGTLSIDGVTGGAVSSVAYTGSPYGIAVTGTLTPDVTGNWINIGSAASPMQGIVVSSNTYALVFTGTIWIIRDVTNSGTRWTQATGVGTFDDPRGTYSAGLGVTGTLTVAYNTPLYDGIKEYIAISRTNSNGYLEPLDFTSSDVAISRERDALSLCDQYGFERRYPSDAQLLWNQGESTLILQNNTFFIYPRPTITAGDDLAVTIDAYAFLADYVAADLSSSTPRDFFLSHGHQYLQWATICEMNYLLQRFVPRQEGVLSPPEQRKAEAWKAFLIWDSYMVASGANRYR